jgi:acetyl-CoA carboxylase carboxyl transferase subunit alpha
MKLAERFGRPVITLIDTPGAYPGIGAEERGQSEAIASNLLEMFDIKVPIIPVVIGEGGSGGALALSVGDRILMLEHSVYSVISPEGCAAILWKKNSNSVGPAEYAKASDALKLTAQDLLDLGVIDEIIPEPLGGAHRNPEEISGGISTVLKRHLDELMITPSRELLDARYNKFRKIGRLTEEGS